MFPNLTDFVSDYYFGDPHLVHPYLEHSVYGIIR